MPTHYLEFRSFMNTLLERDDEASRHQRDAMHTADELARFGTAGNVLDGLRRKTDQALELLEHRLGSLGILLPEDHVEPYDPVAEAEAIAWAEAGREGHIAPGGETGPAQYDPVAGAEQMLAVENNAR